MKVTTIEQKLTKRHLCASGSILLPLAQKWGLVGVAVCGLSLIGAGNVSAASITLTTPTNLSINVTPSAEGTFAKSKEESFSVISNAYAGYTLKISGKGDENALVDGSKKLLSLDIPGGVSETAFDSATYNNRWGYKPSMLNGSKNENFLPGPKSAGDTIEKTASANVEPKNYTVQFGVRVNNEQAAGSYKSTFVISVMANDVPYEITYNLNGGTASGLDEDNKQSGSSAEGSLIQFADTPTRDGYKFLGWCSQATTDENCGGQIYNAGADYKLANGENKLSLYAMWIGIMQNWKGCSGMAIGGTTTLIDIRDENTYRIRKLKDDKCWMIDNIKIADKTLTASDSDVLKDFELPASSKIGFSALNTANVYVPTADIPPEYIKFGGYYTWYAATASTGTSSMTANTNATGSVCPKGWRLPTGGEGGEIETMTDLYGDRLASGSKILMEDKSGPEFIMTGFYRKDAAFGQGTSSWIWSSTKADETRAYHTLINTDVVDPLRRDGDSGYCAISVRCIARQ